MDLSPSGFHQRISGNPNCLLPGRPFRPLKSGSSASQPLQLPSACSAHFSQVGYDGPRRWSRAGRHTPSERRGSEAQNALFGKTSRIGNVPPNHRPLPRLRAPGCGPRLPPARCGPGPGCPGACSPGAAAPVSPSSTRTSGAIAADRSGPPPTAARPCSGRRPGCSGGPFRGFPTVKHPCRPSPVGRRWPGPCPSIRSNLRGRCTSGSTSDGRIGLGGTRRATLAPGLEAGQERPDAARVLFGRVERPPPGGLRPPHGTGGRRPTTGPAAPSSVPGPPRPPARAARGRPAREGCWGIVRGDADFCRTGAPM